MYFALISVDLISFYAQLDLQSKTLASSVEFLSLPYRVLPSSQDLVRNRYMAMSEVAQESHEDIHGDYGTLSATDCVLLACNVSWILGMPILSFITPCKFPFRCSNLSQVFELPRFLLGYLFFPSHPSPPSFPTSLKNFLIRTYVPSQILPLHPIQTPPPRFGLTQLQNKQAFQSPTDPRPHPSLGLHHPLFPPLQPLQP